MWHWPAFRRYEKNADMETHKLHTATFVSRSTFTPTTTTEPRGSGIVILFLSHPRGQEAGDKAHAS